MASTVTKQQAGARDTPASVRASLCVDADVHLVCKGALKVQAHKAILRMASPVWRDLIDSITDCSSIPAEEDCPILMEALMCTLYPISPKPKVNWGNVEALAGLAHKYGVGCAIDYCASFLVHSTFDCGGPSLDGTKPWDIDKHAMRWLRLSDAWGMEAVANRCIDALQFEQQVVGKGQFGAMSVHGVDPHLRSSVRSDEFLSPLSPGMLKKLIKLLAS